MVYDRLHPSPRQSLESSHGFPGLYLKVLLWSGFESLAHRYTESIPKCRGQEPSEEEEKEEEEEEEEESPPLSLRLGLGKSSTCWWPPSEPGDSTVCMETALIAYSLPELQDEGHGSEPRSKPSACFSPVWVQ